MHDVPEADDVGCDFVVNLADPCRFKVEFAALCNGAGGPAQIRLASRRALNAEFVCHGYGYAQVAQVIAGVLLTAVLWLELNGLQNGLV